MSSSNSPSVFPPRAGEPHPPAETPPSTNPSRWASRIVFGLLLAGILGVLAYNEAPREVARWYQAAAAEHYYQGNSEQALAAVNTALHWNPQDPQLILLRAQVQLARQQYADALTDVDQAIEMEVHELLEAYWLRSEIHQYLDQHKAALDDWRLACKPARDRDRYDESQWRNGTAYVRAVGDFELDEALQDVELAIDRIGGDQHIAYRGGVLLYKLNSPQAAARLFGQAAELAAAETAVLQARLETARQSREFLGVLFDPIPFERHLEASSVTLGRLRLYHSLALEAAGEKQQAKTVRQQAGHRTLHKTWMFELDGMGDEYLATLSQAATTYAAYIDTRGYVHYRLGDNEAALRDLTTAVELADASSEYLQQSPAFRAFVANKTTPAEVRYEQRHHWDKSRAVLHYHRALVLQELGQSEQADADLRCVHELGAEPGPKLF